MWIIRNGALTNFKARKNKGLLAQAFKILVPEIGIEPTTYALRMRFGIQ
jgi:hypothetical protein